MKLEKVRNPEIFEKIGDLMACLPSDELKKPNLTPDAAGTLRAQIGSWEKARKVQLLLSQEWNCRYVQENRSYPIEEALDRGEISKAQARLFLSAIVEMEKRWELVESVEPLLREDFPRLRTIAHSAFSQAFRGGRFSWKIFESDYPFLSDFDLFAQILREDADSAFSACLEPYCEISFKKHRLYLDRILKLPVIGIEGGIKYLKSILKESGERYVVDWFCLVLFTCFLHLSSNREVREKLINYCASGEESFQAAITVSKKIPSRAWKKGALLYGTERGGVYR